MLRSVYTTSRVEKHELALVLQQFTTFAFIHVRSSVAGVIAVLVIPQILISLSKNPEPLLII